MDTGDVMSPQNPGKGPLRPFLAWVAGISTCLDWSGRIMAASCLGFMFILLFVNVFLRYAFGEGIAWAYEIHALLLPWLVAGGIVIAAARGRNIAITLLVDLLSPRAQRVIELAIQVAILVVSVSVLLLQSRRS